MSHVGWQYPKYPRAVGQYIFAGNSLTLGANASSPGSTSYPSQTMQILESSERMFNQGVSSRTTPQMAAAAATEVDPLYNASIANRLMVWEGLNDIILGANAATATTNLSSYCTARRAVGFKVVILTIMPISNGAFPTVNSTSATVNANLRSTWTTFADAIADVAVVGALSDATNPNYFASDGIHLIDNGYEWVARTVVDALGRIPL